MTGASSKVIVWNSAGIRASTASTAEKIAFFDKEFPNGNFAIAAFVETHHREEGDIPEEFKEYRVTHHILNTPTPPEHTHSGIIILVNKQYEIISKTEVIHGRLMNIKISHTNTKASHNISVFYGPIWSKMNKTQILKFLENFNSIHKLNDNNIIIGDFNFVDNDIDKGKGMSYSDKVIHPFWERFTSNIGIVDPFRLQCPNKKLYSFTAPTGRSR